MKSLIMNVLVQNGGIKNNDTPKAQAAAKVFPLRLLFLALISNSCYNTEKSQLEESYETDPFIGPAHRQAGQ